MAKSPYIEEALRRILSEPKSAHLGAFDLIQPKDEFLNCVVDYVWKYRLGYGSFMIAKNSPYKIFFDSVILKMSEDGRLQNLYNVWIDKQRNCPKREEVPLGIEKTISMFFIMFLGIIVAMIFIVFEKSRGEKLWLTRCKEKAINSEFDERARILHQMKDWINEEIHNMDMKGFISILALVIETIFNSLKNYKTSFASIYQFCQRQLTF